MLLASLLLSLGRVTQPAHARCWTTDSSGALLKRSSWFYHLSGFVLDKESGSEGGDDEENLRCNPSA